MQAPTDISVMKLGIMQPYFFPYIGYYQLINAVDKFIIYDDVNYIKQGWINKNKVLCNGAELSFIIPIKNISSFVSIANTQINLSLYNTWKSKFIKILSHCYSKAPFFRNALQVIEAVLNNEGDTICHLARESVIQISKYLNINTLICNTATSYNNSGLKGQQRVIDICTTENAGTYINPIGGRLLYAKDSFKEKDIDLLFLQSYTTPYKQFNNTFVDSLSIIDVIMFNHPDDIKSMLGNYDLSTG